MVQLVGTTSLGLGKLIDGKNQFVHIRYSAHSNGSNMTTEIQADTKYIGIATNSSETAPTSPSDYSWGRFVGTPGASSYTWIRYSSNADGSNMTAIPNEETKYIGVAVTAEDSAPTDYTRYSWALFKGSDGRGVKKTEVSYQKSTSGTVIPTGSWLASIPSLNEGEYLWTRTLFTYTDGTTTSTYNVSRNGTSGLGIARTDVHYQKSTSGTTAPTGTWTVTIPTVRANEYLWTRTTITYTDDSTSVSYSVGKMGADGKDAQLLYLTASSQIQAFDKDNQPKTTQPITISAKLQNASGTATFVAIPYVGNTAQTPITLGGTGNDRTLLPSQWTDPKWTIIAITATLGSLTDTISVNKVKDGESGETPVVHIAWADSADGSEGFTLELPTNKIPKYRGYYVDYSTVASTDPKKYKWERNPDDTGAEVDKAMTAVESAVANAEEAERLAATASQTATIAKQEASAAQNAASMAQGEVSRIEGVIVGVQGDIDTALQEVADQAADLQATKETLELNYAKKTEVSDVQAALTTEISKKVGELQTTVSQTYAAKNDVVAMEGRLQSQITQTAGEVSSVVGKVDKLEADTTEAQKKVDEALEKSTAAQAAASQAQAYADAADKKVSAAQVDLNEAKQNLTATINRVDATEADIAEAQLKVESAQAAVAQAQKDAAEAALAASNAQAAANQAQQDVAALTKRVTSAETAITQNSEQIKLSANKTEEIGTKLDNLQVGGRNLLLKTGYFDTSKLSGVVGDGNKINLAKTIITDTSSPSGKAYRINKYKKGTENVYGGCYWVVQKQLTPGKKYTWSAYVRGVGTVNTFGPEQGGAKAVALTSTWTKVSHTFTANSNQYYQFTFYGNLEFDLYLTDLMLEEGNTPTPWSPAPEDQQSQIDGINNNLTNNYYSKTQTDAAIKVASDNITSTVSTEITTVNNKVDNLSIGDENLINLSEIKPYNDATIDTSNYIKCGEVILTAYVRDYSGIYIDFYNDAKPETYYVFSYDITALDSQPFRTIRGHMDTGFYTVKCCIDGVDIKASYQDPYTFSDSSVRKHHVEVYVKLKDEMTNNRRIFIQPNHSAKQTSERYKIENLKIVEGNKYTNGWSPAPSDQQLQIDNIQVGGRNLLRKSNVGEENLQYFKTGNATVAVETEGNLKYYKIRINDNLTTNGNGAHYLSNNGYYNLEKGKHYIFSYWIKVNVNHPFNFNNIGHYQVGNYRDDVSGDRLHVDTNRKYNVSNLVANTWTKVTIEFDTLYDGYFIPYFWYARSGVEICVYGFMLEEGNKPTDWSPAPEDMATADQAQQAQNDANDANSKADSNEHRVSLAESTIKQLSDSISMMVTDSNGSSMMTQTSDGWTFNIGSITDAIDSAANNIDNLSGSLTQTKNVVNNLNNLANDLSKKTAYINMTTDENGAPCIELGKTGNAFKVRITNTSVDFIEGSSKIAYVSNQALFIEKAIIKSELQVGERQGFIWKTRSNGNMGLRWFG